MKKVSEHFSITEFRCNCGCKQTIIQPELVTMLEMIREKLGRPVIIHCINRCIKHNEAVGGVSTSLHIPGKAADFHVRGMKIKDLHEWAHYNHTLHNILHGGLGIYDWGIHVDIGRHRIWEDS